MGRPQKAEGLRITTAVDRAHLLRPATVLLIVTSSACGLVIAGTVMFGWFIARHPETTTWAPFVTPSTFVIGGVGFVVCFAALVTGWSADRLLRRSRTTDGIEGTSEVHEVIAGLALAAGLDEPRVTIIDGDMVNTTVMRRSRQLHVVLTRGACDLSSNELSALVAFDLALARNQELRRVQSAFAAIGFVGWMVKALWVLMAGTLIVMCATGDAVPWGIGTLIGLGGIILLMPLGVIATGAAVTLATAAHTIADRDAVSMTFLPDIYLRVLLDVMVDERRTATRISPLLWFERTTTRDDVPAMIGSARSQRELTQRAEQMAAIARVTLPDDWPPEPGTRHRRRPRRPRPSA